MNKYTGYTYEELLQDECFLHSLLNPTEESGLYWDNLIKDDPALASEVEYAKMLLYNIPFRQKNLSPDVEDRLFHKIKQDIKKRNQQKKIRTLQIAISAAASVLLVFLSGIFYYTRSLSEDDLLSAAKKMENSVLPSAQIQLIQSNNDELTIEGEETVIEYDTRGGLSINSEKIPVNQQDVVEEGKKEKLQFHQLIVPPGKRSFLTLSDGTKVWVNANTRVVYPEVFDSGKREIYVDGEVFLDVMPDRKKAFVVKTNQLSVNVLGTSFNVSAYADDSYTSVVLVNGKVNVRTDNKQQADLSPSDMLNFENGKITKEQVNVDNHISWRDGIYTFDQERFSVIINKLSRYYKKDISWSKNVENLYCTGTLNLKDDILKLLKGLETAVPITFREEGEIIYVDVKP